MKRYLALCLLLVLCIGVVSAEPLVVRTENTADGYSYRNGANQTFVDAMSTLNTFDNNDAWQIFSGITTAATTDTNKFHRGDRGYLSFNTSEIPDDATVTSATLRISIHSVVNGLGDIPSMNFTQATFSVPSNPGDGYTPSSTVISATLTDITTGEKTISITNLTAINKTGYTMMHGRISWDYDGVFGGTWASNAKSAIYLDYADTTGDSKDPQLTIEYTLPDTTTPPESIYNITNVTTCNSINWTWTNPTTSDFNGTMLWLNGTAQTNLSKTTTYYLLSSLPELLSVELATKTFDNATSPNVNATFQNMTAITTQCGAAPVSSFALAKPLYRIPETLQVNDTSTNTPTQWNWSWGDGTWTNGTTQNATHKYTNRGTKSVSLLCSNAVGNNTSVSQNVRIVGYENSW